MGLEWDAFVPPPAVWDECLRVLKPGGHLVAFAGSRTYDLMGLSIRMAGFEIRDSLAWLYGSGMPKGIDVAKAIDKMNGRDLDARFALARHIRAQREAAGVTRAEVAARFPQYREVTANWERTDQNGNRVPTPSDWAVLAPWLDLSDEWLPLIERVEAERQVIGKVARPAGNGKLGTVALGGSWQESPDLTADTLNEAKRWSGWNTALKPAHEPMVLARKPLDGTVAANVLAHGTGGLNVDGCRIAGPPSVGGGTRNTALGVMNDDGWQPQAQAIDRTMSEGRWPANVILDEHAAAALDEQSGTTGAHGSHRGDGPRRNEVFGVDKRDRSQVSHGDTGGASRFFYCAKAPQSERPKVDGQGWPTVKPLSLMRWVVRLVTPPGGTVLDPFAGTGTTLQAAEQEGMHAIGIERDELALRLIAARLGRAGDELDAPDDEAYLFDLPA
jgi:hypothetical protein